MKTIDVIIKSHEKDYVKLPFVIDSLKFLNPQPEGIYLINPDRYIPDEFKQDKRITIIHDDEVLPGCDRSRLRHRPNWCITSLFGVFQEITKNDFYLDNQSDNIFLKNIDMFENGKPVMYVSPQHSHYHKQYFRFSEQMYGFGRVGADSFIIDFMFYDKSLGREMRKDYKDFAAYYDRVCEITTPECYVSDQEIYGNWVAKHHPDRYVIKSIDVILRGKKLPNNYTANEIREILSHNYNVHAISLHTWN